MKTRQNHALGFIVRGFLVLLLFLSDCGIEIDQPVESHGANTPSARPDFDSGETAIIPDPAKEIPETSERKAISPTSRVPCVMGSCWLEAPEIDGACPDRIIGEDFSSGRYNVHRYPFVAPANKEVRLTLEVVTGSWEPALLVVYPDDGSTIFDGEEALSDGEVRIEPVLTGRSGRIATVSVTATSETRLDLFVSSWETVDSGFTIALSTESKYTLGTLAGCPLPSEICPMDPNSIIKFGSGFFTTSDSRDPSSPAYSPYIRDGRNSHSGYDIHAPMGTPVLATQDGTIVSATTVDNSDCGRSVTMTVASGVSFRYCHLDQVLVTAGEVSTGQVIALNGATGNANVPHVHFVYLESKELAATTSGEQKSSKVNQYIDNVCR